MATLFIPSLMLDLTGGAKSFESPAETIGELLAALDRDFPGTLDRLAPGGKIRPGVAVAVDGEVSYKGIRSKLHSDSVVRLLPAVKGG